jgi:acyl dehydratase
MKEEEQRCERLVPGRTYLTAARIVTQEEILEFANRYDPLPLHTDEEFARRSRFGKLIAPGFLALAIAWELWVRSVYGGILNHWFGVGVSLEDLRWLKPLKAGDRVWARVRVLPESGLLRDGLASVGFEFELFNDDGELVLTFRTRGIAASQVLQDVRDDAREIQ